ncbi:hypothetical protein B9T31_13275 [Acinetobacter sp. ANC 4558]|uniref:T6SS immunity protein Tli4 family protein n=1 Tax=Acinetobacter sp. ANC 4558 TaxID=1977876 RepID=UPI000A359763|nr:T6SS immunity protein Tli4 family protein [Acinetobacter sp. ANC 4558]OTG84124.1 hypothetical protein B9T31_13275 [Acinetobacter sp. ANC 4558]
MNKLLTALALTGCIFNISCTSTAQSQVQNTGKNMINLEKTRPYCIGRYVVDIPVEAKPLKRFDQYDSFIIKVIDNATRQDFDAAVQKRKKEYSEYDWFITEDPAEQKNTGRLTKTLKGKKSKDQGSPFTVFGFILDKNTLFLIEGNHSDTPRFTKESNEAMQHLIKDLRYRAENEIPKENGQCIYQGFIKDNDKIFRYSEQSLGFDFEKYPTLVLRFKSETTFDVVTPLIPRIEQNLKKAGLGRLIAPATIRKGEKNTQHLTGQEWISVQKMTGKNGISAVWEHVGTTRKNQDPLIEFETDTGYETQENKSASLAQVDALKLYESILKTIRKF